MALSEAEGQELLAAALSSQDDTGWPELLGERSAKFVEWARHHPRLSVVAADAWAERGQTCAKPRESALLILAALVAEAREERAR